jgi:hypothetical protein
LSNSSLASIAIFTRLFLNKVLRQNPETQLNEIISVESQEMLMMSALLDSTQNSKKAKEWAPFRQSSVALASYVGF